MFFKHIGILVASVLVVIAAGCSSPLPASQRGARYRPQAEIQKPLALAGGTAGVVLSVSETGTKTRAHQGTGAAKTVKSSATAVAANNDPKNSGGNKAGAANVAAVNSAASSGAGRTDAGGKHDTLRRLKSGDRVTIALRGIPSETEVNDVIDGWGEVTLPYIGEVKIVGKTVSEAERKIERLYVDGGIYNHINVIVMAEDEVYFVQGEVARQGKFSLSGKVTLLQAISEAGGYTPFANRRKIKVMRGDKILMYNGKAIAEGKVKDPPVFADDIIEVLRRWVF